MSSEDKSCSCSGCACSATSAPLGLTSNNNPDSHNHNHDHETSFADKDFKKKVLRILVALFLFACALLAEASGIIDEYFGKNNALYVELVAFLIPFVIAGYDVLISAVKNISKGHGLDENFLMAVATVGAFALVLFPDSEPHMAEGAAVMLFYQVGELFQDYAVGKSRRSIKDMMDIAPEYANIYVDGKISQVAPQKVTLGELVIVRPGERIPLDGIVEEGTSQIDTSALTGESVPRSANVGDEVISGCINLTSSITIKITSEYANSTVNRILELVENAANKKAKTENFIRRFARLYTPIVVALAAAIAIIPPTAMSLFGIAPQTLGLAPTSNIFADWILRGLTFLVVSCPCALVIAVPLSFFGGIGGASRVGVLVKGSNYLEMLSNVKTVVFDKTGTLTSGTFEVTDIILNDDSNITKDDLLDVASHVESLSTHPIAVSIQKAYGGAIDMTRVSDSEEIAGHGIRATVDGKIVLVGNDKLMYLHDINYESHEMIGTKINVAVDGNYVGTIIVGDTIKADSKQAIQMLHKEGVTKTVMLTGDAAPIAKAVAETLGVDEYHAELLPTDKVNSIEHLFESAEDATSSRIAFVGDGINDAPVLTRADVGIAMGAMGSDAAIEAADVVLMDDHPTKIATAIRIAKRTMAIVKQNITFALAIKFAVLILAAIGIANMWMAVFADVGVAVLCILNSMRAMRVQK